MPVHRSRDHRFLGLDAVEWLLMFGAILMLGVIVTLSHLINQPVGVANPLTLSAAEFI
jgi:hypothetical protein